MKVKTAAEARKMLLGVEVPAGELALRIAEQVMGLRRPNGATPEEAFAKMDAAEPGMSACFLAAATAAVLYFRECVNNGKAPN